MKKIGLILAFLLFALVSCDKGVEIYNYHDNSIILDKKSGIIKSEVELPSLGLVEGDNKAIEVANKVWLVGDILLIFTEDKIFVTNELYYEEVDKK